MSKMILKMAFTVGCAALSGACSAGSAAGPEPLGSTEQPLFVSVPSRIEAEKYERALESTPGANAGGQCNRNDGVDMELTTDPNGGGCNVGWTSAGEWLEYDINTPVAASFNVVSRVASNVPSRTFHLNLDGVSLGSLSAPASGWQSWADRTYGNVNLSAGKHTLRVVFDTGDVNLNYVELVKQTASACVEQALPRVAALASSAETSASPASYAIDGNSTTRWSSLFSDPQWLSVDLGAARHMSRVLLNWEAAASAAYDIAVSDNVNGPWATVYTTNAGDGGVDDLKNLSANARYVRLYSRARTTQWGNSLWEAQIYGDPNPNCGVASTRLLSKYFAADSEALAVAKGQATVQLPTVAAVDNFGLQWRVTNALRMLGYEPIGIATGEVIGSQRLLEIDSALVAREARFDSATSRLPNYRQIWAPDFKDNLPQSFGVNIVTSVFDLYNTNGNAQTKYMSFNNECVLANYIPQMCGALVDMGTTDGSSCKDFAAPLRAQQIIQNPDLNSFSNVRRPITATELPIDPGIQSTCGYVATLVHEFAHDLDSFLSSSTNVQYDRTQYCSPNLLAFYPSGTPFAFGGAPGTQLPADFVTGYAAGLTNQAQDYRAWEDVAESMTSYLIFPEYFRARAALSARLQAKYDFIKSNVFGGAEFTNPLLAGVTFHFVDTTNSLCGDHGMRQFRVEDVKRR